jgi:hypothetical protein
MKREEAKYITRYFADQVPKGGLTNQSDLRYSRDVIRSALIQYRRNLYDDGELTPALEQSLFALRMLVEGIVDTETFTRVQTIRNTPSADRLAGDTQWLSKTLSSILDASDAPDLYSDWVEISPTQPRKVEPNARVDSLPKPEVADPGVITADSNLHWIAGTGVFLIGASLVLYWITKGQLDRTRMVAAWALGAFSYPFTVLVVKFFMKRLRRIS